MPPSRSRTRLVAAAVCALVLPGLSLLGATGAVGDPATPGAPPPVPVPDWVRDGDTAGDVILAPSLRSATGAVTVSVAMSQAPVAVTVPEAATREATLPSAADQQAQTAGVVAQQDTMVDQAQALGATELGRASTAANVVALSLPAERLTELSQLPGVVSVKPVARYHTLAEENPSGSLAQAADYLQATAVRDAGTDGTGITVAVLDSGIDYTHAYLGGPGTGDAYAACYQGSSGTAFDEAPVGACAELFGPDAPKVKGGIDFVGETWTGAADSPAETTDPNPIDLEGHGTHVADIIGGRSADGAHEGLAPGVDLYAVKVCAAVSTACSGVALLQGVDWALDPDGDGDISDAMDIVNLSLGQSYGQEQDDLTVAIDNLVRAGVVAVVSAGNSADRPFIVGSPSTADRAISVAQTALPDDELYTLTVLEPTIEALPDNQVRNSKLQSWSPPPVESVVAPLDVPGVVTGCATTDFDGFPAGSVALIARGTCAASVKAQNAEAAGAVAVVIANNVPGDPPDFSFGGGDPVTVPTFTVAQADGGRLAAARADGAVEVAFDPADTTSLTNTVVGTSSRGPAISGIRSKPDIGAPGAWLSAEVGTGSGETNFGGTSGAAPVVSGAAALVLAAHPELTPALVKARLLNSADTGNRTPDATAQLYPTPISRIGAGEVRVAPAVAATGILAVAGSGTGNVGLGLPHLKRAVTYPVRLALTNTGDAAATYALSALFRDPADEQSGAVTVALPGSVTVAAGGTTIVRVRVTVDPAKLDRWPFSHAAGYTGDGSQLNGPEFDGIIQAASETETLHLGWTVLPQRSADVAAAPAVRLRGADQAALRLTNRSAVLDGAVEVFALTGTSRRDPRPAPGEPGSPGSNAALIDLAAAGVRDDLNLGIVQFAVAGNQRQTVPLYPAGYEVDIDTDRDGAVDFAVFHQEAVGFAASGVSVVYVTDLATNVSTPYYYLDADFDDAAVVLSAPLAALGLSAGDTFDFSVTAYDNYFSGTVTDVIEDQTWKVGAPEFVLADSLVVPAVTRLDVTVTRNADAGETTQSGFLMLYDDAARRDAQVVQVR